MYMLSLFFHGQLNEIESRIKSTTPKRTPLLLKPSPSVKTPDRTVYSDSEDENEDVCTRNPKQLHLNRVPRAPAATPQVHCSNKSYYT